MNFSRIGRQLDEGFSSGPAGEATRAANEKAMQSKQKSVQTTERSRQSQKAHMSQEKQAPEKSGVSYTSEEATQLRKMRELNKMRDNEMTDWREEMMEAAKPDAQGNHPFIDVMPFADHKMREAKKQMKDAVKAGGNQAAQGNENPVAEEFIRESGTTRNYYGDGKVREKVSKPRAYAAAKDRKPFTKSDTAEEGPTKAAARRAARNIDSDEPETIKPMGPGPRPVKKKSEGETHVPMKARGGQERKRKRMRAKQAAKNVDEETRELCAILQEKYGMSDDEFFEYAKKKGFKVPPKKKAVKEARNPDTDGSREADVKKIDSMPKPHTERGKEKKVNYGKASTKEIAKDYDDHLKRRMTYDQRPVSRRREALRKGMNG